MNAAPWPNEDGTNAETCSRHAAWWTASKRSTRRRWRAATLALTLWGSTSLAQTLNLDAGAAPPPGSGIAALAVAESLEKQAADLYKGSPDASARARAGVRRLAAGLLRAGEQRGISGSPTVLAGRTIAARLDAFDAAIATDRGPGDRVIREALARDLAAVKPEGLIDPSLMDRTLRDVLSPLLERAGDVPDRAGWVIVGGDPLESSKASAAGSLQGLAESAGLDKDAVGAFTAVDASVATAQRSRAYRDTADEAATLVRAAGRLALRAKPAWLSEPAMTNLRAELIRATADLTARSAPDPSARTRAISSLATLAGIARLVDQMDAVDATGAGRSSRLLREALSNLLSSPDVLRDASLLHRIESCDRALALVLKSAAPVLDQSLVRQLRPAWAAIEPSARQSALQVLDVLPRLVRQPGGGADPAPLGAISIHARRVADLSAILEISRIVSGGVTPAPGREPLAADALKPVADRILLLSQDLLKPKARDLALAELRDLTVQIRDYANVPGERELRAEIQPGVPAGDWSALTNKREKQLVSALNQARDQWLAERATPRTKPTAKTAQRLAVLRDAISTLHDAATVHAASGAPHAAGGTLNSWPGWELSPAGLNALMSGLVEHAVKTTDLVLSGNDEAAMQALRAIRADFAAALLAGRLERLAADLPIARAATPTADALAQVALGPPTLRAWLADQRQDLAAMCRYAEELAAAESRKNAAAVTSFRNAANRAAISARAQLDADSE